MKNSYEHKKTFVVVYAKDKYELPIISSHSLSEISQFLGVCVDTLKTAIVRNGVIGNLFRVLRVNIQDNPYQEYGCADRNDYLNYLSEKYNISKLAVQTFAQVLGEKKDFTELVEMCETISMAE